MNTIKSPRSTEKHRLFFEFLLISPSYQLAHEFVHGLLVEEHFIPPDDFDVVLRFYALAGSVYGISFEQWWNERGAILFASANNSKRAIPFRVDLSKSVNDLVVDFKKFLTKEIAFRNATKDARFVKLFGDKAHLTTLRSRLSLVIDKARRAAIGKPLANWELAIFSGLESSNLDGLKIGMKLSAQNESKRVYAGMWVSRLIKEAEAIAESASRGLFPSLERHKNMLELDLKKIYFYSQLEMRHFSAELKEKRAKSKLSNKDFSRKQMPADVRAKLKLKELVDEQVAKALRKIERERRASGEW